MLDAGMRVLLIVDDRSTRTGVTIELSTAGLDVRAFEDGCKALDVGTGDWRPDVIVIDLLLSTYETYVVCRSMRSTFGVPMIVVTTQLNRLADTVDCTLPRPIVVADLIRAIESRAHGSDSAEPSITIGDCVLSPRSGLLHVRGKQVLVSRDEQALLTVLASTVGRPVRRIDLRGALNGIATDTDPRVVDVHLIRLMVKLETTGTVRLRRTPANDAYVLTIDPRDDLAATA